MPNMNNKFYKGNNIKFPKIRCIYQDIPAPKINDLEKYLYQELDKFKLKDLIKPRDSVGITGSSRGISNQALLLKSIVKYIHECKAKPFIFPAMGSHGGGTAEGQLEVLRDYGITEVKIGCPIKSTMEVVSIGKSDFGTPIYLDKHAASADKIILLNKINSHSKFIGDVESGLSKMSLLGIGKHKGAKLYHQLIARHSWPEVVHSIRTTVLEDVPIICGVGVIHNIKREVAEIHVLHPDEFSTKEPILLKKYKSLTERMPFKNIDLLIVDEMGKNIFGTGMDTNITGRKQGSEMIVKWLFVRDLTEETRGNAQGIGLADFTTKRLVDKIDYFKTYFNALTAHRTDSPKIPIFLPNDRDVMNTIFDLEGIKSPSEVGVVWIKNTTELNRMLVSESLFAQVNSQEDLSFISEEEDIKFDDKGNLTNSNKYWF